ncbi:hypothetical protein MMPV_006991 [Pyropia vietnamensis]
MILLPTVPRSVASPAFVAAPPGGGAHLGRRRRQALCGRQPAPRSRCCPATTALLDGSLPGSPTATRHKVTVLDSSGAVVRSLSVPEDRYIWHAMEDESGVRLPSSCRHGCCTTCAVKLTEGTVDQREALGLLREMRDSGYALLCVSKPRSDITCVLQEEDEVYVKQFGSSFESGGVEWGGGLRPR